VREERGPARRVDRDGRTLAECDDRVEVYRVDERGVGDAGATPVDIDGDEPCGRRADVDADRPAGADKIGRCEVAMVVDGG
jgi:hypothetical protein